MKFCNQCGAPVRLSIPAGDNLARHVCDACGTIHYQNPRLVVGCVADHEGRILHVFFRAALSAANYAAGAESLEVALVSPDDIPWTDIAFPSTDFTLRRYLEDRAAAREPYHFTTIDRRLAPGSPKNQAS
jgi:NMD protein affecting ribosome stability and mRNA decay